MSEQGGNGVRGNKKGCRPKEKGEIKTRARNGLKGLPRRVQTKLSPSPQKRKKRSDNVIGGKGAEVRKQPVAERGVEDGWWSVSEKGGNKRIRTP